VWVFNLAHTLLELARPGLLRRQPGVRFSPPAAPSCQSSTCCLLGWPRLPAGVNAGDDEVAEAGDVEGQEGIEGVDWRYGSVEELDPSEWQVQGLLLPHVVLSPKQCPCSGCRPLCCVSHLSLTPPTACSGAATLFKHRFPRLPCCVGWSCVHQCSQICSTQYVIACSPKQT
jgi:hypothetical protein